MASIFCRHCGVTREHGLYCTSCGQRYEERTQPAPTIVVPEFQSDIHSMEVEQAPPSFIRRVIKFSGYLFTLVLIVFTFAVGAGSIVILGMVIGAVVTFLWMLTKRG